MTPNQAQLREAHMRAIQLGLAMNLLAPVLIFVAGVWMQKAMAGSEMPATMDATTLRVLFWAFLVVSAGDLAAVLFIRKRFLQPRMKEIVEREPAAAIGLVLSRYIVMYAIALSPSVLGLVYYMLGGSVEDFVLFGVLTLLIYRLVRPKQEFFYSLFGASAAGVE